MIPTSAALEDLFSMPANQFPSANCAGVDPEIFFPAKGGSTRQAKKVCANCIHKEECLNGALERREPFGIWGGLSERERRKILPPLKEEPRSLVRAREVIARDRKVIELRQRGWSFQMIADHLAISLAAAEKACSRAKRRAA